MTPTREALDGAVEAFGEAMDAAARGQGSNRDASRCRAEVHRLLDEICPKEEEKNDGTV